MKIEQIFEKFLTGDRCRWYDSRRKGAARMPDRTYLAIDLKSFYASVECAARGLDPLKTNLVVADAARTEKTICLAVSPPLKSYGVPGRPRLFEVIQRIREVNEERRRRAPGRQFRDKSWRNEELKADPSLAVSYLVAPPRMAHYMKWSTQIYQIYLRYVAPEDIHVYSIDEVFMDVTEYLGIYKVSPRELAKRIIRTVLEETGITATAGIGTNLYLCKVAMDIVAKHVEANKDGVRIAELDEQSYRELLWTHEPLTDFWRVGPGYQKKLWQAGLRTMGDIARCSLGKPGEFYSEELLYQMFGVNAELLIDHAWGYEPCTIAQIRAYKPQSSSLGCGQVLPCPYTAGKARIVVQEMIDGISLELVEKRLVTDQLVLTVGYDIENLTRPEIRKVYKGPVTTDRYGRRVPKHAHGTWNLPHATSSSSELLEAMAALYDKIVNPALLIRRMSLSACHVVNEKMAKEREQKETFEQLDLFTDYAKKEAKEKEEQKKRERERRMQEALLTIKKKYGKNAVLRGMNFEEGATAKERNGQIGGHQA